MFERFTEPAKQAITQAQEEARAMGHPLVGTDALDPFGKRIIDLQRTLVATTLEELEAAGEALGRELAEGRA